MATDLPEKRIKKIKLPGDVEGDKTYEIIPEKLQSNGFQATLPTLTEDSTIALTSDIPAAQVNADWNASSGVAEILNKPTLGTAASKNIGTSSGNVPVLDSNGKLADSVIPAVAITDTYEATSEAAMLALTAQKGDVCIRSDLNKSFILSQTPASTLANWKELKTPTDAVLSVNSQTGVVTLDASDVGALDEDTSYLASASASGNTLTITPSSGSAITYTPSFTDNDHYPTTFAWTNGTTSGPTGSLTGNSGFSAVSFGAIPAASASQSGIVTTDDQTFAGQKTFAGSDYTPVIISFDTGDGSAIRFTAQGYDDITYSLGAVNPGIEHSSYQLKLPAKSGVLAVQGKSVIEKVNNESSIPNEELGLYRFTEEVEGVTQSSHIYEAVKEDHGAEETEFPKVTTTNGTQLNTSTFIGQFDSTLSNFVTSISTATNVYCFYYNNEYVSQNGIRIGTKNTGTLTLTLSEAGSITFGKYFSYNGSTHVVTYDTGSKVIVDGTDEYTFATDTSTVTIDLNAGTHTITSNGQDITGGSAQGRIILVSFEFEGAPYSIYSKKALARVEDVNLVETKVDQHIATSNVRFADDERAITTNTGGITDINSKLGNIQIFERSSVPTPTADWLNKIIRVDGVIYQCIRFGNGVSQTWDFANVNGTSEITSSNVSSFYGDAGNQFSSYFEVDYNSTTTKFYRNTGSLKLGSGSNIGVLQLNTIGDAASLEVKVLKFGVKAFNTNGSTVDYKAAFYNEELDSSQTISGNLFISDNTTETLIDLTSSIPSGYALSYLSISSNAQHNTGTEEEPVMVNNDKRLVISSLSADFGVVWYSWSQNVVTNSGIFNKDNTAGVWFEEAVFPTIISTGRSFNLSGWNTLDDYDVIISWPDYSELEGRVKLEIPSSSGTIALTSDIKYTNPNGTTVAVGGIAAGTTFDHESVLSILEEMLYPYVAPINLSISTTDDTGTFEYGTSKTLSKVTPSWTAGSKSITSIKIGTTQGGSDLYSSSSATSGTEITLSSAQSYDGTQSKTIYCEITDGQMATPLRANKSFTFTYYPYYAIVNSETTPTDSTVVGSPMMKSTQQAVKTNGISIGSSPTYTYFYVPSNMSVSGQIKYKDGSAWNNTATTDLGSITIRLNTNVTASYHVYKTATTLSGLILSIQ